MLRRRFLGILGASSLGSLSGCRTLPDEGPTRELPVPETEAERETRVGQRAQKEFQKGMSVNRMADILEHPAWVERERVIHYAVLGGYIPLNWGIGQTALHLDLVSAIPRTLIYVAVDGRITADELRSLLAGTASEELTNTKGMLKIADFTIEPIKQ